MSDVRIYHAVSFIAGALEAASQMDQTARKAFRARILAFLRPDRDFRAIEHEVSCFVHFRQRGYSVRFSDYENFGRYDFLASKASEQFEIECKLISPDIGYPVKIERSVGIFEKILRKLERRSSTHVPAGIYQIRLSRYDARTLDHVPDAFQTFLSQIGATVHPQYLGNGLQISFDPRPLWESFGKPDQVAQLQFLAEQEQVSANSVITNVAGSWCMIRIVADRAPRIVSGIVDEIKGAAKQLSRNRPGLIWVHLAGWSESELRLAAQQAKEQPNAPLNIISTEILKSTSRDHVSAIWYSAAGSSLSVKRQNGETITQGGGPAYMTQSHVGRFPLPRGLVVPQA